jgi:hypothetical protein
MLILYKNYYYLEDLGLGIFSDLSCMTAGGGATTPAAPELKVLKKKY